MTGSRCFDVREGIVNQLIELRVDAIERGAERERQDGGGFQMALHADLKLPFALEPLGIGYRSADGLERETGCAILLTYRPRNACAPPWPTITAGSRSTASTPSRSLRPQKT